MKNDIKSAEEIALMRQAGLLVWGAHQVATELVRPGITTGEINAAVEKFIEDHHAEALFKGVPGSKGPFPAAACISVNEQIVHGIPGARHLVEGDIVSIDIGCRLDGWCGDAAVTRAVGKIDARKQKLLDVTEIALRRAIELIPQRQKWSQVAKEIEAYVKRSGFSVVEGLVGHSIGRELWGPVQVPNYYTRQYEVYSDFELVPGVVIAVEPMVNTGVKNFKMLDDGWTIVTQDNKPSAHFEHTIAITPEGPQLLTAGPDGKAWAA